MYVYTYIITVRIRCSCNSNTVDEEILIIHIHISSGKKNSAKIFNAKFTKDVTSYILDRSSINLSSIESLPLWPGRLGSRHRRATLPESGVAAPQLSGHRTPGTDPALCLPHPHTQSGSEWREKIRSIFFLSYDVIIRQPSTVIYQHVCVTYHSHIAHAQTNSCKPNMHVCLSYDVIIFQSSTGL